MDLKAFNKICSEAEEAIAERRLYDALALCEAILHDTPDIDAQDTITTLRQQYSALIDEVFQGTIGELRDERVNALFREVINTLAKTQYTWHKHHPVTSYGRIIAQMDNFKDSDIIGQFHILHTTKFATHNYHETLDALFSMLWNMQASPSTIDEISRLLNDSDLFARRTLVSALLLGILDNFSIDKLHLLLAQAMLFANTDEPDDDSAIVDNDLLARIVVAITIIYQRYQPFFDFFTDECATISNVLAADRLRPHLTTLLHAFTSQSLTDRVGHRVDDILPVIQEAFEKHQPHLGSNDDDESHDPSSPEAEPPSTPENQQMPPFKVQQIRIDLNDNERLFDQLAAHARRVDEMRQADLDINHPSFSHMKRFPFFAHPAHWFYPFDERVPHIREGIRHSDGSLNRLTLSIMSSNRFCDSDCYSYAGMMAFLHEKGRTSVSETLDQQMQEMGDSLEALIGDDELPERLNPFTSYCQSLHRFFYNDKEKERTYRPFAPDNRQQLPMLPIFKGLFDNYEAIHPSIDACVFMGDSQQAIILLDAAADTFGTNAQMLFMRGHAYMQLQLWQRALSAFQQYLLFEDDRDVTLDMARSYEAQAQWAEALPLLQNELELRLQEAGNDDHLNDDTISLIEETGRCLIQLERWDEAVQPFFRLELMGRHLNVARRAIAWCSIHQGKYERATTYYQQIINLKRATWEDHLNLGHALWLQGLTADAIKAYRQSQTIFNRSKKAQRQHFRHWAEAFQEDARTLLAHHFDTTACALMMDAVVQKK